MAALFLKLQEEGRLSLDDPISNWLPSLPRAKRITVRMLLNHRSGIYDYFANPRYERSVFKRPRHRWRVGETFRLVGPSYCLPGRCFRYSNTNYVLLGRIARKVTGKSVASNIRTRFLDPLGLRDTFFQGQERIGKVPAKGYLAARKGFQGFADGSRFRPNTSAATVANAAGALVSSVRDVSDWEDALLSGNLLAPESLEQMTDFHKKSRLRPGAALCPPRRHPRHRPWRFAARLRLTHVSPAPPGHRRRGHDQPRPHQHPGTGRPTDPRRDAPLRHPKARTPAGRARGPARA